MQLLNDVFSRTKLTRMTNKIYYLKIENILQYDAEE